MTTEKRHRLPERISHLGDETFFCDELDVDRLDPPELRARRERAGLPHIESPAQLAEALNIEIAELRFLSYFRKHARYVHYRRFEIPKSSGEPRAIWAPLPRLAAAQKWIAENIASKLLGHPAAHGFKKQRSILSSAQNHVGSRIIICFDLRDFFPSVTFRRVKGLLRHAGYPEQVATCVSALCTEAPREKVTLGGDEYFLAVGTRALPQGAPSSPALSNAVCRSLDNRLSILAARGRWRYTRYADDLTFSYPLARDEDPGVGAIMAAVRHIIADEGFEVNETKTRVLRTGSRQAVTGLIVNGPAAPRVPRSVRRMLRAATHNAGKGRPLKPGETLETLMGYAAFVYMTDSKAGAGYLKTIGRLLQLSSQESNEATEP